MDFNENHIEEHEESNFKNNGISLFDERRVLACALQEIQTELNINKKIAGNEKFILILQNEILNLKLKISKKDKEIQEYLISVTRKHGEQADVETVDSGVMCKIKESVLDKQFKTTTKKMRNNVNDEVKMLEEDAPNSLPEYVMMSEETDSEQVSKLKREKQVLLEQLKNAASHLSTLDVVQKKNSNQKNEIIRLNFKVNHLENQNNDLIKCVSEAMLCGQWNHSKCQKEITTLKKDFYDFKSLHFDCCAQNERSNERGSVFRCVSSNSKDIEKYFEENLKELRRSMDLKGYKMPFESEVQRISKEEILMRLPTAPDQSELSNFNKEWGNNKEEQKLMLVLNQVKTLFNEKVKNHSNELLIKNEKIKNLKRRLIVAENKAENNFAKVVAKDEEIVGLRHNLDVLQERIAKSATDSLLKDKEINHSKNEIFFNLKELLLKDEDIKNFKSTLDSAKKEAANISSELALKINEIKDLKPDLDQAQIDTDFKFSAKIKELSNLKASLTLIQNEVSDKSNKQISQLELENKIIHKELNDWKESFKEEKATFEKNIFDLNHQLKDLKQDKKFGSDGKTVYPKEHCPFSATLANNNTEPENAKNHENQQKLHLKNLGKVIDNVDGKSSITEAYEIIAPKGREINSGESTTVDSIKELPVRVSSSSYKETDVTKELEAKKMKKFIAELPGSQKIPLKRKQTSDSNSNIDINNSNDSTPKVMLEKQKLRSKIQTGTNESTGKSSYNAGNFESNIQKMSSKYQLDMNEDNSLTKHEKTHSNDFQIIDDKFEVDAKSYTGSTTTGLQSEKIPSIHSLGKSDSSRVEPKIVKSPECDIERPKENLYSSSSLEQENKGVKINSKEKETVAAKSDTYFAGNEAVITENRMAECKDQDSIPQDVSMMAVSGQNKCKALDPKPLETIKKSVYNRQKELLEKLQKRKKQTGNPGINNRRLISTNVGRFNRSAEEKKVLLEKQQILLRELIESDVGDENSKKLSIDNLGYSDDSDEEEDEQQKRE